ncbi:MAG: D-glycero-beta-D-manno-heptose-7-phosphate kinase [Chloroflexi bacterium]|nr:D-glycero-beta-D-manno-heptose-7-phosphate kinase [Chloroflexota bacterium]
MTKTLETILSEIPGQRVLVLGDLMLDEYIWGSVQRISPEAPVPVVEVDKVSYIPGGAANVAMNVCSLGGISYLVGVVGDDQDGVRLATELQACGISKNSFIIEEGRPTTKKTRVIAHSQQVVRTDHEKREPIAEETAERIVGFVKETLGDLDAIVVSDYSKGVLTPPLLSRLMDLAKGANKPVVVDPKGSEYERYRGCTVITPNKLEASRAAKLEIDDGEALFRVGQYLLAQTGCEAVLVTCGPEGMFLFERNGQTIHLPTVGKSVYDVTGAGDTVVAAFTLGLAAGADFAACANIANHAAGIVVGKVGTATVTIAEIERAMREW